MINTGWLAWQNHASLMMQNLTVTVSKQDWLWKSYSFRWALWPSCDGGWHFILCFQIPTVANTAVSGPVQFLVTCFVWFGGRVLVRSTSDCESVLFWFWILFTERDLSWKCSIKISHLLMWVSTITRWPTLGCKARLIWRRGSSQGRFSVQFLGFFLLQTPPSPQQFWGVPGLLLLGSTASMAAQVQGQGFKSSACSTPLLVSPKYIPGLPRWVCSGTSPWTTDNWFFQMHSMAGYVTGSFRIPLTGNIKSKSVC